MLRFTLVLHLVGTTSAYEQVLLIPALSCKRLEDIDGMKEEN